MRGIAALCVVLHHVGVLLERPWLFGHGYLFVDLFFLLSGFVLARTYEPRFAAGLGVASFMLQRLVRLYPMILLGTLLGLAVGVMGGRHVPDILPTLGLQLALVPILWRGAFLYPLNNVQWSLLFELLINVAHAALLRSRSLPTLIALAAVSLGALVWAAASFNSLAIGYGPGNWIGGVPRVCFSYILGIILYRLHARSLLPRLGGPWWLWTLAAVAPVLAATLPVPRFGSLKDVAIVAVVFPAVLIGAIGLRLGGKAEIRAKRLGELSYPLYAIHYPLLLTVLALSGTIAAPARLLVWAGGVMAICALSALASRFYDTRMRGWAAGLVRRALQGPQNRKGPLPDRERAFGESGETGRLT